VRGTQRLLCGLLNSLQPNSLRLELHPCRPEDVLVDEVAVPGSGIVEEGGVPALGELHGEAERFSQAF